jgi:hypothetical protein
VNFADLRRRGRKPDLQLDAAGKVEAYRAKLCLVQVRALSSIASFLSSVYDSGLPVNGILRVVMSQMCDSLEKVSWLTTKLFRTADMLVGGDVRPHRFTQKGPELRVIRSIGGAPQKISFYETFGAVDFQLLRH